jgi:hypothetical protein
MAILKYIAGIPLFSTLQEALDYGNVNGLEGHHTHMHNDVTGYMAGYTHQQAIAPKLVKNRIYKNNTRSGGGGMGGGSY